MQAHKPLKRRKKSRKRAKNDDDEEYNFAEDLRDESELELSGSDEDSEEFENRYQSLDSDIDEDSKSDDENVDSNEDLSPALNTRSRRRRRSVTVTKNSKKEISNNVQFLDLSAVSEVCFFENTFGQFWSEFRQLKNSKRQNLKRQFYL